MIYSYDYPSKRVRKTKINSHCVFFFFFYIKKFSTQTKCPFVRLYAGAQEQNKKKKTIKTILKLFMDI